MTKNDKENSSKSFKSQILWMKNQKLTELCFHTSKTLWAEVKTHVCRSCFFFHFFATPFRSIILGCKGWAFRWLKTKLPHFEQRVLRSRLIFGLALRYTTPRIDFPQPTEEDNTKLTTIQNKKSVFSKGSRCWGCFRRQRCAQRRIRWCRRCHAYSSRRRSWLKAIERSVAGKASRVLGMAASFFLLSNFTLQHTRQYILPCKGTDWSWI